MALLLLDGVAGAFEGPADARDRQRIRTLLTRPAGQIEQSQLAPAQQAETDELSSQLDEKMSVLSKIACEKSRGLATSGSAQVSKRRVLDLLEREAGLSAAAARRAYQVQTRFAASHGLSLFGH